MLMSKPPCGSCPYRRDVPSGIWEQHEYDKLPEYDGETWQQSPALFLCHQRDGNLCGGWLACHGPDELLALRFHGAKYPDAFSYETNVPVFSTGAAARRHGMRDIPQPGSKAGKMIAGLVRKRVSPPRPDRKQP
jgi:hypothetical protein